MRHQRHFATIEAVQRQAVKIRKMIGYLDHILRLFSCAIAIKEEHATVFYRSDVAYPILARMMAARRYNLQDTIIALEERLSTGGSDRLLCRSGMKKHRRRTDAPIPDMRPERNPRLTISANRKISRNRVRDCRMPRAYVEMVDFSAAQSRRVKRIANKRPW
jgi:hypothetical protein